MTVKKFFKKLFFHSYPFCLIFIVLEKVFNLHFRGWFIEEPTIVVYQSINLEKDLLNAMEKELKN
jgi:hypothetical protein